MRCEVKRHKCRNMRPNVAKLTSGMDCSVVPMKRGNARGGRGAGHLLRNGGQLRRSGVKYGEAYTGTKSKDGYSQGGPVAARAILSEDELPNAGSRGVAMGGTSRMTGDRPVRICEGSRVQFPRSTRQAYWRVKANRGVAGIDGESLEMFEADLTGNLYKLWNRLSSGSYFPPPVRQVEYARFADDVVILIDAHPKHEWLLKAVDQRLREEFAKLQVQINDEKSRVVDLARGESFGYLGFDFRRTQSRQGNWRPHFTPKLKKRTELLRKLREIFRRYQSQPILRVVDAINPILRGWVNYFAIGHSSRCFGFVKSWVEKKIRRHLMRSRKRRGFGWERWTSQWLYATLGLFNSYRLRTDLRYSTSTAKSHKPRHEANR